MTLLRGMFERLSAVAPPEQPQPTSEIQAEVPEPIEPRYSHWSVVMNGKTLCSMVGEPMTQNEALEEVRHKWPTASVVNAHPVSGTSIL